MGKLIIIALITTIFYSCISSTARHPSEEVKYVSYVLKLPSPDGRKALYSYVVKYPEAHYGYTRFVVLPETSKFAPSDNFFSFSDTLYGWSINSWSGDTVNSICITPSQRPPKRLSPYKTSIENLKNCYWRQDYYFANSFYGVQKTYFDSIVYSGEKVIFVGKDTSSREINAFSIVAQKGQITVPLGDSIIRVSRLESFIFKDHGLTNADTTELPPLVSLTSYVLKPKNGMDWKKLKDFGVFVEQQFGP